MAALRGPGGPAAGGAAGAVEPLGEAAVGQNLVVAGALLSILSIRSIPSISDLGGPGGQIVGGGGAPQPKG